MRAVSASFYVMDTTISRKNRLDQQVETFRQKFPNVRNIRVNELNTFLSKEDEKIVLVDVRMNEETKVSMIPGALTKKDFEQKKEEFRDFKVVCYCTVGYRSAKYAENLLKEGFNAQNLEGSILGWTHEGLPLTEKYIPLVGSEQISDANQGVKIVHVFAKNWELQREDYEAVWFGKNIWESITGGIGKILGLKK